MWNYTHNDNINDKKKNNGNGKDKVTYESEK